jgi:uncharacterized membrane protein
VRFRIGETDFQLVMRPASQPTLIGATRPPADEARAPIPSIGTAQTLASDEYIVDRHAGPMPSEISTAPMAIEHAPTPAPLAAPVPVVPPRRGPPPSAPSFVDFGPVGRPEAPRQGESFTGELVDDPSRVARTETRVTSRFGTWVIVVLLFVGLSLLVVGLAYDITFSDVMAVFE